MCSIENIVKDGDEKLKKEVEAVSEQKRGKGIAFHRLRRITGYVSVLHQFNDGKKAEERDRVKHM